MMTGEDSTLMHYFCVKPEPRYQNMDIALLKTITGQPEYCNRKIMAVTASHSSFLGAVSLEITTNYLRSDSSVL